MVFSSIIFLCFFLPIVLAVGLALQWQVNRANGQGWPLRLANAWLVVASLVFYAWGEIRLVWVLVFSGVLNYLGGLLLDRTDGLARRTALASVVAANLAVLAWFKYSTLLADLLNRIGRLFGGGHALNWHGVTLPLGISFFTFHGISYVVDVWRRKVKPTRSLLDFTCYYTLFPQLVAGPIVRFSQVASAFTRRTVGLIDLGEGAQRFVIGLGKKTLIANQVATLADTVFALPASARSTPAAWLGVIAYALQIYFDFSGYSDMAIGLGRIFGFRFPENFDYPYISTSVREFWRRWHMTLSFFFRDYLYIPLGGNRCGTVRTALHLVLVFALCGLWHGANWTFLAWGLFHGFFLAGERIVQTPLEKVPSWLKQLGHLYAMLVVLGGWILFRCDTIAQAGDYFRTLFGFGASGWLEAMPWNVQSPDVMLAMLVGAVCCTPFAPWVRRNLAAHPVGRIAVEPAMSAGMAAVLILSLLSIGSGSHNPFIYYRF